MSTEMKLEKQMLVNAAVKKLQEQNIRHTVQKSGNHIIVYGPEDQRIDLWPTTAKWMRQGQAVSTGMHVFWKAVAGWGSSDGA